MPLEVGQFPESRIGLPRPVLAAPHPLLRRVARRCPEANVQVATLAANLLATMRLHPGCVGLAAPQIGVLARVVAVDVTADPRGSDAHGTLLLVNPEIVLATGSEDGREGCLSLPGLTASIRRAAEVVCAGLSIRGEEILLEARGFEARVLQHELDHLDGVLIHDRVESLTDLFPCTQPSGSFPLTTTEHVRPPFADRRRGRRPRGRRLP